MTPAASRDQTRDRLLSSLLLAVLLHALAFVGLELFLKLMPQKLPEYHGPLMVQLEELPVVQQARQPAQQAAAPAAAGQAQAVAAPAAGVAAPAAAAEPPLPSGPPLRTAAPATGAAAPTGSPFRMEGAPVQAGPPRPSGQGSQVSSSEPTLPPAGAQAQGPPLRATAPGEGAAARPGGKAPAVPLEQVDRALASGARQGGAAGAQAGAAASAAGGAQAGAAGSAAQSGAGQAEASREGISIVFDKPDQGREPNYTPLPVIPKWVSDAGLRLTLDISFALTPQGVLDKVKIEKSCGYSDVDWAVLVAVRRWKFKPAPASAGSIQGKVSYLILPR